MSVGEAVFYGIFVVSVLLWNLYQQARIVDLDADLKMNSREGERLLRRVAELEKKGDRS